MQQRNLPHGENIRRSAPGDPNDHGADMKKDEKKL